MLVKHFLVTLGALCASASAAAKFASCSGVYGSTNIPGGIKPFINVTLEKDEDSIKHNFNYTTLIFHYTDIKHSNIPTLEDFQNANSLKICGEKEVQDRECRELGKFVVNYSQSDSKIYNEVLNINDRSFLEYEVTETGFYCVYIESLDANLDKLDKVDVKFQQEYGYLSLDDYKSFKVLTSFQLPVISILLCGIVFRFIYLKHYKHQDVSLIQRAIFHYTYLVYLITFCHFLRLGLNLSRNIETSYTVAILSLLLIIISYSVESLTWGLVLVLSHGFGTLYDRASFPKLISKEIYIFMATNFVVKVFVINTLSSNVQELNNGGGLRAIQSIISLIGFVWVVTSFYKTTKEISMYFDLTTSKLFKRSGYVIFFTPILVALITIALLTYTFVISSADTNMDVVDITETFWRSSAFNSILAIPSLGDFITIIILDIIWENVDSQKVDEENVAEYGAPKHGELSLGEGERS